MKSQLWDCRTYRSEITGLANRGPGLVHEPITERVQEAHDAITALVTVEPNDDAGCTARLALEIEKMCRDTGRSEVVLVPFAHISNNLADGKSAIKALDILERRLAHFRTQRVHFGSDKSLLLDVVGHRGNVRFREFIPR